MYKLTIRFYPGSPERVQWVARAKVAGMIATRLRSAGVSVKVDYLPIGLPKEAVRV